MIAGIDYFTTPEELSAIAFGVDELLKLQGAYMIEELTRHCSIDASKSLRLSITVEQSE
jgi:hypothetical protein